MATLPSTEPKCKKIAVFARMGYGGGQIAPLSRLNLLPLLELHGVFLEVNSRMDI